MNKQVFLCSVLFLMPWVSGAALLPVNIHFNKGLPLLPQLQEAINRDLDRQEQHLEHMESMSLPTFVQMVKEIALHDRSAFTALAYQFGFVRADTSNEHPLVVLGGEREIVLPDDLAREWNVFLRNLRFSVVHNDPLLKSGI